MPPPTSLKPIAARVSSLDSESMMRRGDLVRMANSRAAPPVDTDDGFPPGVTCDCGNCIAGVTIPDGTECCTSHTQWSLVNPWLECEDTDLTLEYIGVNEWLTEPFDGPDCDGNQNEYRWHLTIDVDGRSYLTLDLETDNGCDPVCVIYGRDGFDCQCDNAFSILKPYGTFIGVERRELSCFVCIKPSPSTGEQVCGGCPVPDIFTVELTGIADDNGADCDLLNGTYVVQFQADNLAGCVWSSESAEIGAEICEDGLLDVRPARKVVSVRVLGTAVTVSLLFDYSSTAFSSEYLRWTGTLSECPTGTFELTDVSRALGGADDCLGGFACSQEVGSKAIVTMSGGGSPTSTGVCDETCDPPVVPTNPSGSCCFEGECYSFWDEALCDDFGGEWDSASDDCTNLSSCEESLACCVAGTCVPANGYVCGLLGGTATAGDCDDGVCEEGACCDASDGTCSLQQAADCVSPNYFWGAGTECDPDPCPDLGACCQNDDDQGLNCGAGVDCECVLKLEADCIGTFAGAGTNCTTSTGCDCRAAVCDFL